MTKKFRNSSVELTVRQRELLEFIHQSVTRDHRMPSLREMAKALGVQAVGTIQDHIQALVDRGDLLKSGRQLQLSPKRVSPTASIPIVGEVAAGSFHDAFEVSLGALAVSAGCIPPQLRAEDCFALRVKGLSMVEAGIFEGDFVVVCRSAKVKDGDFVVADLGGEVTLKEIRFPSSREKMIRLIPHNATMKPLLVDPSQEFRVIGKVVGLQRYWAN
jgi:repressor LexA